MSLLAAEGVTPFFERAGVAEASRGRGFREDWAWQKRAVELEVGRFALVENCTEVRNRSPWKTGPPEGLGLKEGRGSERGGCVELTAHTSS